MKKKLLLVLLMATILVTAFTGCKLFDVTATLEFVNAPQTEYTMIESGDSLENLYFTARLTTASQTLVLAYDHKSGEGNAFTVENFDLSKPGTRTATVTYNNQGVSLTFQYTVVEPLAADKLVGTGSTDDPYELSSANDFVKMVNYYSDKANQNFELTSDIDFSDLSTEELKAYVQAMQEKEFNFTGTLNGNGYTIYNLTVPGLDGKEDGEQLQMGLFYKIAPALNQTVTIKNLNFQNCSITNSSAAGVGILGFGDYPEKITVDGVTKRDVKALGTVVIDNVDMYNCHVSAMKNSSLYIGYAAGRNFYFTNCDVDANSSVRATASNGGTGTFIGSGAYINRDDAVNYVTDITSVGVSFDNCTSAATLTGNGNVHGFLGNTTKSECYTAKRSNGSRYTGTIYTMQGEENAASILPGVANTTNDSYTIYYAGEASKNPAVGYVAFKTIKKIDLKYVAGNKITIPAIDGVQTYIVSYSFARSGSTYGNSETITAVAGSAVTSNKILYYTKVYDFADTNLYPTGEEVATALMVYGPLSATVADSNTMDVTFSVYGLNGQGKVVAFGSVKKTGITYITAPETAE